jgi:hypothetical protein
MDGDVLMIRRYSTLALSAGLATSFVILFALSTGCGSTDCSFTATCGGGAIGATDAGDARDDAPVVIPNDCDLTKSPKDSPSCVADGVGIFVDASKTKADATGTKLDPLPTITAAISKAILTKHPRIYVCDGKYTESIKLNSAVDVYGGFDCSWSTKPDLKPKITPVKGAAIEVTSVADQVVIENVNATGLADAAINGSTAIGAFIVKSRVVLRGVVLSAGAGQDGAKGSSESNYLTLASQGTKASASTGGKEVTCTCGDGTTSQGGHGADGAGTGVKNGSSVPAVTTPLSNSGGSGATSCTPGTVGANGERTSVGEPVMSPGLLTATGWDLSKLGGSGLNGHPAQGGGGGGAQTDNVFAGGGGGCGGCGGAGGGAGKNGGGSIALVSVMATVALEQTTLNTDLGGRGGDGGDGQGGQDGGDGGAGICKGGLGGVGAGGSGGAGGAGGDSIAIAWDTTEPTITATDLKPGNGGLPGSGGSPGTGSGTSGTVGKTGNPGKQVSVYHQQ